MDAICFILQTKRSGGKVPDSMRDSRIERTPNVARKMRELGCDCADCMCDCADCTCDCADCTCDCAPTDC